MPVPERYSAAVTRKESKDTIAAAVELPERLPLRPTPPPAAEACCPSL